jgi:hypothetical protein
LRIGIAFHDFWNILSEGKFQDITPRERVELAKEVLNDPQHALKVVNEAEMVVRQFVKVDGGSHPLDNKEKRKELVRFFTDCGELMAKIISNNVPLDFIPKQLPKKGTLVNNIVGQPFDYKFNS